MRTPLRVIPKPLVPSTDVWTELDRVDRTRFAASEKPEGSFTTIEFARRYHIGRHTALSRLHKLEREGMIEICGSVITEPGGRIMTWRLVKKS